MAAVGAVRPPLPGSAQDEDLEEILASHLREGSEGSSAPAPPAEEPPALAQPPRRGDLKDFIDHALQLQTQQLQAIFRQELRKVQLPQPREEDRAKPRLFDLVRSVNGKGAPQGTPQAAVGALPEGTSLGAAIAAKGAAKRWATRAAGGRAQDGEAAEAPLAAAQELHRSPSSTMRASLAAKKVGRRWATSAHASGEGPDPEDGEDGALPPQPTIKRSMSRSPGSNKGARPEMRRSDEAYGNLESMRVHNHLNPLRKMGDLLEEHDDSDGELERKSSFAHASAVHMSRSNFLLAKKGKTEHRANLKRVEDGLLPFFSGQLSAAMKDSQRLAQSTKQVITSSYTNVTDVSVEQSKALHRRMDAFLKDSRVESAYLVSLVSYGVILGVEASQVAHTGSFESLVWFEVADAAFCLFFVFLIALRTLVWGRSFFRDRWNVFDFVVVLMHALDIVFMNFVSVEFMRNNELFRKAFLVIRVLRVVRLVRIVGRIPELRMMVHCIAHSLRLLLWLAMLYFMVNYTLSVFLQVIVNDFWIHSATEEQKQSDLGQSMMHHYGSLTKTTFSLYMAVTGGADWSDVMAPVTELIDSRLSIVYALYVAFVLLGLMNWVTGVFVDNVNLQAKQTRDKMLVDQVCAMIESRGGWTKSMAVEDFHLYLDSVEMQNFLKSIGADPDHAERLFNAVPVSEDQEISAEDFFMACIRLSENSKALDSGLMLKEVNSIQASLTLLNQELGDVKTYTELALEALGQEVPHMVSEAFALDSHRSQSSIGAMGSMAVGWEDGEGEDAEDVAAPLEGEGEADAGAAEVPGVAPDEEHDMTDPAARSRR